MQDAGGQGVQLCFQCGQVQQAVEPLIHGIHRVARSGNQQHRTGQVRQRGQQRPAEPGQVYQLPQQRPGKIAVVQQIHPEGQRCQPKDPAPPVVRADADILEQQKHRCRSNDRSQCLIAVDGIHKTVQVQSVFHPQRQHPVEQPRRRSCQICQQTQPAGHGHPVFAEISGHKIQSVEPDKAVPVIHKGFIRCPVEQRAPHALQQQRHQQQGFVLPPIQALHHHVQHRHREVHQKISRGEPVAVGGKG